MKPQALIGALIGGVIGAVIWGVIAHLTGYEHSLIAIGVGALVGFGAKALGGEGAATGLFAVVITVGAIFAGKMIAVYLVLNASLDEINARESHLTDLLAAAQRLSSFRHRLAGGYGHGV